MEATQFGGMIYGAGYNGESCLISVTTSGLEFAIAGQPVGSIRYNSMEICFTGTDDRYVKFASGTAGDALHVLTGDKSIVDEIKRKGSSMEMHQKIERVMASQKRRAMGRNSILIGVVAAVVLSVIGLFFALKPAASLATEHIPTDWEKELGRSEAQKILEAKQTCTDEKLNAAVHEIGRRLVMGMGKNPYHWQIKVIDDPEVNAFALPGGYVFINRGLIEASDSAEEVAGVLAHEFQHVLKRHGIKNVVANMGLRLVLFAIIGDMEAVQGFLVENMAALAAMEFSRTQEAEADSLAVDLAYRSKIDPHGFLRFMKKLEKKESAMGSVLTIVSTHPGSAERMEEIAALIKRKGKPVVEPFSSDWETLRKKCSPAKITTPDSLDY